MISGDTRAVLRTAFGTAWFAGYAIGGALPFYAAFSGLDIPLQYFCIAGLIVALIAFVVAGIVSYWTGPRASFGRRIARGHGDVISHDDYGRLWRLGGRLEGGQILVVEVMNVTAEPDGTYRRHFLRVPPQTRTAREGVAWTFGFDQPADFSIVTES